MREVHALISNILSGPATADTPKPQDPLATWKAARQRCSHAESALHRSESHNVVLVKRLEKAKAGVQDVEKQMLEAAATLKAAQSEHDEAHAALRGLPETDEGAPKDPPEVLRAQDDLAAAAKRLQEQKELAEAKRRKTDVQAQTEAQAKAAQLEAAEQFKAQQEKQAKAVADAAKLEAAAGGNGGAPTAAVSGSSG